MDDTKSKKAKHTARSLLSRLRSRKKKKLLQLEDFDDVRYKMEIVRLGDDSEVEKRIALWESIFLALLCMMLLGGCVAVGFATHLIEYSKEVLSWLIPMTMLPLLWVAALHLWERHVIAMQSKIATS